jgi:hypothetical protein
VVAYEDFTASCGHVDKFGLFEDRKDKFREARRQKARGRPCRACREKRQKEELAAAEARKAAHEKQKQEAAIKKQAEAQKPKHERASPDKRLPDGSTFEVRFDATKVEWAGTLTVPGAGTFTASARAVFTVLTRLDRRYRDTLPEPGEAPPETTPPPV